MEGAASRPSSAPPSDDSNFYGDDDDDKDSPAHASAQHITPPPGSSPTATGPAGMAASSVQDLATTDAFLSVVDTSETGDHDDGDSSSDMDLSEPSRSVTPEPLPPLAATECPVPAMSHAGAKRKLNGHHDNADHGDDTVAADEQAKKRRLYPSSAAEGQPRQIPRLPAAIWQRVFMHLPPAVLCRCLRVCKEFSDYLTRMKPPQGQHKDKCAVRVVDSEATWTTSRKAFLPQLPRPLARFSELEMLKLIGGQTCQTCGKVPQPPPATSIFNCGPGLNGVRVIFPFGLRTCGSCIEPQLLKVSDSRSFSSLRSPNHRTGHSNSLPWS